MDMEEMWGREVMTSFKELGLNNVAEPSPTRVVTQFLYGGDIKDPKRIFLKNNILLFMMQHSQKEKFRV